MKDFSELQELADRSSEPVRRRLIRYMELRQTLAELTGDDTVNEGTPMLGLLYEQHPNRKEIVMTAGRLRALGRVVFSKLEMWLAKSCCERFTLCETVESIGAKVGAMQSCHCIAKCSKCPTDLSVAAFTHNDTPRFAVVIG